jgi:hypothetical protein
LTPTEDDGHALSMARLVLAVLACCALATHVLGVMACGRSELLVDDAGSSGDEASGDEASGDEEAIALSDAPVVVGDDAPLEIEASEEDALFFAGPPLVDGSSTVASDGGGCGPSTCQGCCEGEFCRIGASVLACGMGGQECVLCGPELSCPRGTCQ